MTKEGCASQKVQKVLSGLGLGSRRKIETWIVEERIKVNGRIARLGDRIDASARITFDGRPINIRLNDRVVRVLAYHKPLGEISTRSDPQGRPTIFRSLPKLKRGRWISVGRLDVNTGGLILFTNDGELANRLMHPSQALEREYLCRVYGKADNEAIGQLKTGIRLNRQRVRFHSVQRRGGEKRNTWYSVIVKEGRYREVRKLWESVGCQVNRLIRIRYGNVVLPRNIKPGQYLELDATVIAGLAGAVKCGPAQDL